EMQRRKIRAKGPWHLGATRPEIQQADAPRIGVFLLERSVDPGRSLHPEARRVLDGLEGRSIGDGPSLSNALAAALSRTVGAGAPQRSPPRRSAPAEEISWRSRRSWTRC